MNTFRSRASIIVGAEQRECKHALPSPASVLVVEDDLKLLRVYSTSLAAAGYLVVEASNGQRAIEEVRTRTPDVILLDLGLPDIDGLDLVPTMRADSAAPIIVVSAREQDADKVKALDEGAIGLFVSISSFAHQLFFIWQASIDFFVGHGRGMELSG